jgi:hypothetical protein
MLEICCAIIGFGGGIILGRYIVQAWRSLPCNTRLQRMRNEYARYLEDLREIDMPVSRISATNKAELSEEDRTTILKCYNARIERMTNYSHFLDTMERELSHEKKNTIY